MFVDAFSCTYKRVISDLLNKYQKRFYVSAEYCCQTRVVKRNTVPKEYTSTLEEVWIARVGGDSSDMSNVFLRRHITQNVFKSAHM